jgi:hypothetical protein
MNPIDAVPREKQNARPGLASAGIERQEFWVDTCREATQMQIGSKPVLDLYRRFGCRFCVPTHQQVQSVLDALDSAMPDWEKLHPQLFFQTLELNFPELVRRS